MEVAGPGTGYEFLDRYRAVAAADNAYFPEKIGCYRLAPIVIENGVSVFDSATHALSPNLQRNRLGCAHLGGLDFSKDALGGRVIYFAGTGACNANDRH